MKALIIFFFPMFLSLVITAQSRPGIISSSVKNNRNEAIQGATVSLLNAKDSAVLHTAVTDENGKFLFKGMGSGVYLLMIKTIGQRTYHSIPLQLDDKNTSILLPVIIRMEDRKNDLAEVVISGKRPLIQMEIDKTVVNVDAMISSASSNTMEVLEKTPGITVNGAGDLSLNGRSGVLVLIDGRSVYMSGQDLSAYLKSIPGSLLDKIELIDNPSAKYDSSGNGIINIRLKKKRSGGFTGSVSTGFTQGKYGRTNDAVSLNYNEKKINVFGNLGYSYEKNYSDDNSQRHFYNTEGSLTSMVSLLTCQKYSNRGTNANLGLDYAATENTTYGFQVGLNGNHRNGYLGYNSSNYGAGGLDSTGRGSTKGGDSRTNFSSNVNLVHKFGKSGKELSADLNYLDYSASGQQSLQNSFYGPDGSLTGGSEFLYNLPSSIHIYTLKADYVHPLQHKAKLEAGFKSSWVNNDNLSDDYLIRGNEQIIDNTRSNHFKYKENINSAYLNGQKNWKHLGIQLGIRVENTIANGQQMGNEAVAGSSFRKDYTQLFPAAFISYKLDTLGKHTFTAAVTRRISRPNYQLLNEFLFLRDQYSYSSGNSMLMPQYQYRYEVKYQYRQFLRMGLSYNHFTNGIFQTNRVVDDIFITRPENIATGYMLLLNTGISVTPAKWWSLNSDILLSKLGLDGNVNGTRINPATYVARINVLNQFSVGKKWSAELGGYYASRDLNGQAYTSGMYRVNAGVQKKILRDKGSLRFSVDDAFHSWIYHNNSFNLVQADYFQTSESDTQRFGIAFTYRFGRDTFSRKSKHQNNALDEEKGRM